MALHLGPTVRSNTHTLSLLWVGLDGRVTVMLQCDDNHDGVGFSRFLENELRSIGFRPTITFPHTGMEGDRDWAYTNAVFEVDERIRNPMSFLRSLNRKMFRVVENARRSAQEVRDQRAADAPSRIPTKRKKKVSS